MADGAISEHPGVQEQLDRLSYLSPGRDVLGLQRISALLDKLGNPQDNLPPVFHVAGTNGKGSTCAFLRAAIEASGQSAHVFTSPHLVRFNERFRIAGKLIEDEKLSTLMARVLDISDDIQPSFFEVTTAVAFLAFAETPADAVILEVGLGGRLDATNIVSAPAICGIASLGIDHESFLLAPENDVPVDAMDRIAFEKTGIAKTGVPLVTQNYRPSINSTIEHYAALKSAPAIMRGRDWDAVIYEGKLHYKDETGKLALPLPRMAGVHQSDNAALAIAMLRHQDKVTVPESALVAMMEWTDWPARMQKLGHGPLTGILPEAQIWLDGGHNADAGIALAQALPENAKVHVICGMLANKDARKFLEPLTDHMASFAAVPIDNHEHHDPKDLCRLMDEAGIRPLYPADNVEAVLKALSARAFSDDTIVLICGSLYLAGQVLEANEQLPQ